MKKILFLLLISTTFLISCQEKETTKVGEYTKAELPKDFSYIISKDKSNSKLDKNHLDVVISQKLNENQIATLAEEIYNSKNKQGRFYIFYKLKGQEDNSTYWASSHFNPEIKIEITGNTEAEDLKITESSNTIDEEVIGKWNENKYTLSTLIIFKKDNKIFIRTISKFDNPFDAELKETKTKKGIRYDYKEGGYAGEYFILNTNNQLELYNDENKNFTTALPL